MQPALHLTTKVLPGNKIEIEIPEGEIGDTNEEAMYAIYGKQSEKVQLRRRGNLWQRQ